MCDGYHVVHQRTNSGGGQSEEQRHGDVECGGGGDSGKTQRDRKDEISPVVVVQVSAAEPRIERRQDGRTCHRCEVG